VSKRGRPSNKDRGIERDGLVPVIWGRIQRGVEDGVIDPIHGSQLGRLSHHRRITETQFTAAHRVGQVYGRFERTIGARRNMRSPSYEMGFAGKSFEGQRRADLEEAEEARAAKEAWDKLQGALTPYPKDVRNRLEQLCVEDQSIGPTDLPDVCLVLDHLAEFYGVVSAGRKSPRDLRLKHVDAPPTAPVLPKSNNSQKNFVQAVQRMLGEEKEFEERKVVEAHNFYQALNSRDHVNRIKERDRSRTRKP
jgi:hypothetical protein